MTETMAVYLTDTAPDTAELVALVAEYDGRAATPLAEYRLTLVARLRACVTGDDGCSCYDGPDGGLPGRSCLYCRASNALASVR